MSVTEKTQIGVIDVTPSWSGILPALLILLESGTDKGKVIAIGELKRMAEIADKYVAGQKVEPVDTRDMGTRMMGCGND